jgi:hypothetical protein
LGDTLSAIETNILCQHGMEVFADEKGVREVCQRTRRRASSSVTKSPPLSHNHVEARLGIEIFGNNVLGQNDENGLAELVGKVAP